ncbi:hypothetical protein [Streptosporangium sp. NBC_01756]|uniref:hypothetical protein n=1 Tax=Streptosporangium sp. NBC_01756 TaxID=2975950 RepID=UPI002DDC8113|nr:hypothetical protein [Streptosporangium sp. NBC_01756]WSC89338.1 hypothetical protein OIE48_14465 [Streptosporangium sp. NBC_01756]
MIAMILVVLMLVTCICYELFVVSCTRGGRRGVSLRTAQGPAPGRSTAEEGRAVLPGEAGED